MLKNRQKILIAILLLIAMLGSSCYATEVQPSEDVMVTTATGEADNATNQENNENVVTAENNENVADTSKEPSLIEDDQYLFDKEININQYIDGNVYAIGTNITISGKVGGDVYALANNITLTKDCYIYGNLYAAANTITVEGITCDLYAIGQNLKIAETGVILRDLRSGSSDISLAGNVGRNVHLTSNNLSMEETAHIYGNLNYSTKEAIVVPEGTVDGQINYNEIKVQEVKKTNIAMDYALSFASTFLYTLIIFGLLVLAGSKFINKAYEVAKSKKLACFGIGLLAIICIPTIAFLFLISIIALPISLAVIAVYILLCSITLPLCAIVAAKALGEKVQALSKFNNLFALILTTLILWALTQLPVIGGIVSLLITIFGFGLFTKTIFKKENNEN